MSVVVSDRRAVWCCMALAMLAAGCASPPRASSNLPTGSFAGAATPDQLQSAVMSFADRYVISVADATNLISASADTPEIRMGAARNKMASALAAFTIATEANPIVAVLDMTTMVTLKRMVWEDHWESQYDGPGMKQLGDAYRRGEEDIWDIARQLLTDEQEQDLHDLIVEWRAAHPDQRFVSYVRLKDFDIDRNLPMEMRSKDKTSIFQLLYLDPLSGLDPSTRELGQLRRMLERQAYFAQRLPLMASLFVPQIMADLGSTPEVQQLLTYMGQFTGAAESLTTRLGEEGRRVVDQLNADMQSLQVAASGSVSRILADERQALIADIDKTMTAQREGIFADLKAQEGSTRALIEQATALAKDVRGVIDATAQLTARDAGAGTGTSDPDRHSFDVREYEAAAARLSEAAQSITQMLGTLDVTLRTPAPTPVSDTAVGQVIADFESSLDRSIDKAFMRLLALAGIVIVGVVAIKLAGTWMTRSKA